MSILKSTNSGRGNILLTVEYLLQNGWYYTSTKEGEQDWRLAKTPLKIYTQSLDTKLHFEFASSWDVMDCYSDEVFNFNEDINLCMLALKEEDALIDKSYNE